MNKIKKKKVVEYHAKIRGEWDAVKERETKEQYQCFVEVFGMRKLGGGLKEGGKW